MSRQLTGLWRVKKTKLFKKLVIQVEETVATTNALPIYYWRNATARDLKIISFPNQGYAEGLS